MTSNVLLGGDILGLITAGMYNDPMVVYREYIQNAADAICARDNSAGVVSVGIDVVRSRLTIQDNGTGLTPQNAANRLVQIGNSTKTPGLDRGFRGIGRLSALAFADTVTFTTRTCAADPVTQVSWSGLKLRQLDLRRTSADSAVQSCTSIVEVPQDDWPDRFFHVAVEGISRQAASLLLNREYARTYIGEVCPVPFASSFPLARQVESFLSTHSSYLTIEVTMEDDQQGVCRPFSHAIPVSDLYAAQFERLETRIIPQMDGEAPAAILWLAHTPYSGSIAPRLRVRGLRARAGNIQVGSDCVFEHLFHEARFNGWCIGEVHVVDKRILPNGRRDYFEPSPHLRNLENHLGAVAHEICLRCRSASSQRNKIRTLHSDIGRIKNAQHLIESGFLLTEDAICLLNLQRNKLLEIKETLAQLSESLMQTDLSDLDSCLQQMEANVTQLEFVMQNVPKQTVLALQSAFGVIAREVSPDRAHEIIRNIVLRFSRQELDSQQTSISTTKYNTEI